MTYKNIQKLESSKPNKRSMNCQRTLFAKRLLVIFVISQFLIVESKSNEVRLKESKFKNKLRIMLTNEEINESKQSRKKRDTDEEIIQNYLIKYGYMGPGALHANGDIQGQVSISRALKNMQRFLGIPATGRPDPATIAMMSRPRCGNQDTSSVMGNIFRRKKRYTTVGFKWNHMKLTYAYTNYTPKIGKEGTESAIDAAFAVWAAHAPLDFVKVQPDENPDIVILFAKGYHNDNTKFDGKGGYLAHAFYPGPKLGGDTHFDMEEPWIVNSQQHDEGNDLFLVAVHELGHALGLGHSPETNAIMAPVYQYHDTANFKLPQDDINGIQNLYGTRNRKPEKPIVPITTKVPKTTTQQTTTTAKPTTKSRWWTKKSTTTKYLATTSRSTPSLPELCKLKKYDAVTYLRNELYIFSGQYLWRKQEGKQPFGPFKIASFWPLLSGGIDGVFENPVDASISFFKGKRYYKYDTITLLADYPVHFDEIGLYSSNIDTAVWWERNGKTYIFKGDEYWRMGDEFIDPGYPKNIDVWTGIPRNVDAAFIDKGEAGRNITYFVKGDKYWKFDNWNIHVIGEVKSFSKDWLNCNDDGEFEEDDDEYKDVVKSEEGDGVSVTLIICLTLATLLITIALLAFFLHNRRRRQKMKASEVISEVLPAYSGGYRTNFEESSSPDDRPSKRLLAKTMIEHQFNNIKFSLQHKV